MDDKILEQVYQENLEERLIAFISEKNDIPLEKAMEIYYRSKLSQQINDGSYGIENMDYRYLVQDLIENESELIYDPIA